MSHQQQIKKRFKHQFVLIVEPWMWRPYWPSRFSDSRSQKGPSASWMASCLFLSIIITRLDTRPHIKWAFHLMIVDGHFKFSSEGLCRSLNKMMKENELALVIRVMVVHTWKSPEFSVIMLWLAHHGSTYLEESWVFCYAMTGTPWKYIPGRVLSFLLCYDWHTMEVHTWKSPEFSVMLWLAHHGSTYLEESWVFCYHAMTGTPWKYIPGRVLSFLLCYDWHTMEVHTWKSPEFSATHAMTGTPKKCWYIPGRVLSFLLPMLWLAHQGNRLFSWGIFLMERSFLHTVCFQDRI